MPAHMVAQPVESETPRPDSRVRTHLAISFKGRGAPPAPVFTTTFSRSDGFWCTRAPEPCIRAGELDEASAHLVVGHPDCFGDHVERDAVGRRQPVRVDRHRGYCFWKPPTTPLGDPETDWGRSAASVLIRAELVERMRPGRSTKRDCRSSPPPWRPAQLGLHSLGQPRLDLGQVFQHAGRPSRVSVPSWKITYTLREAEVGETADRLTFGAPSSPPRSDTSLVSMMSGDRSTSSKRGLRVGQVRQRVQTDLLEGVDGETPAPKTANSVYSG